MVYFGRLERGRIPFAEELIGGWVPFAWWSKWADGFRWPMVYFGRLKRGRIPFAEELIPFACINDADWIVF